MKQTTLGRTTATVSAIGLGCAGMSHTYGNADDADSFRTMQAAVDAGINFFDTSDLYGVGHNESLIGRFIPTVGRDRLVIGTKFGSMPGGFDAGSDNGGTRGVNNTPEHIVKACDASLKRLGIDVIDVYYMHRRDPNFPLAESIGAMSRLVEAGKVRFLGLSEVSAKTLHEACAIHPITALESEYSLWTRDPEQGVLQACRELGITFVPFSPLGRAFLTGKLDTAELNPNDFRASLPRFQGEAVAANKLLVEKLAAFAAQRNSTPAQIALAWLLAQNKDGLSVVPIPGTKRPRYIEENANSVALALSAADIAELDMMFAPEAISGARYNADEAVRAGT